MLTVKTKQDTNPFRADHVTNQIYGRDEHVKKKTKNKMIGFCTISSIFQARKQLAFGFGWRFEKNRSVGPVLI